MSKLITIEQPPVTELAPLSWITEDELAKEPSLRRADPEFAYKYGGEVVRAAIDIAANSGNIRDNSIIMVQRCTFVPGYYPIQPEWHFDYTPGRPPARDNATFEPAIHDSTGIVACVFDINDHPNDEGTLFLQGDSVILNLDDRRPGIGGRSIVLEQKCGPINWYSSAVDEQVEKVSSLQEIALRPNMFYRYTSSNLHFPSLLNSVGGTRLVIRVNTPNDEKVRVKIKNTFYKPGDEPKSIFLPDGPDRWKRLPVV